MSAARLTGALVVGDSIVGRLTQIDTLRSSGWTLLRAGSGERIAIPVSAITRVEVRGLDKRRTYGPLVYVGALVGAALVLVALAVWAYGAGQ